MRNVYLFLICNLGALGLTLLNCLVFYVSVFFFVENLTLLFGISTVVFFYFFVVLTRSFTGSKIRRRMYFSIIKMMNTSLSLKDVIVKTYNKTFCNMFIIYFAFLELKQKEKLIVLLKQMLLHRKMAKKHSSYLTNKDFNE